MKEGSWKVLVQTFKSLVCLFVSVFCLFWTCCHWRGDQHMLVPGSQISPLSSTRSRGPEPCSYHLKPQVDWEDKCWAGAKKDPKTSISCVLGQSVWHRHLPLASSEVSDVVFRCVWLLSHCYRCPSRGRSRFLVFTMFHQDEWMSLFSTCGEELHSHSRYRQLMSVETPGDQGFLHCRFTELFCCNPV